MHLSPIYIYSLNIPGLLYILLICSIFANFHLGKKQNIPTSCSGFVGQNPNESVVVVPIMILFRSTIRRARAQETPVFMLLANTLFSITIFSLIPRDTQPAPFAHEVN